MAAAWGAAAEVPKNGLNPGVLQETPSAEISSGGIPFIEVVVNRMLMPVAAEVDRPQYQTTQPVWSGMAPPSEPSRMPQPRCFDHARYFLLIFSTSVDEVLAA